jgi:hypothetical protein
MLVDVLQISGYSPPRKSRKQSNYNPRAKRKSSPWQDSEKSDDEEIEVEKSENTSKDDDWTLKEPQIPLEERLKRVDQ